jgi:hypothetical protein
MPSLRSQSGWGTRLLVDFELLEVCNEAAFVQYSAILQAVCLKSEIYIADINDVVYVLVTTDLHMIPVGEHPESQFPHSLQQMFPGRVVGKFHRYTCILHILHYLCYFWHPFFMLMNQRSVPVVLLSLVCVLVESTCRKGCLAPISHVALFWIKFMAVGFFIFVQQPLPPHFLKTLVAHCSYCGKMSLACKSKKNGWWLFNNVKKWVAHCLKYLKYQSQTLEKCKKSVSQCWKLWNMSRTMLKVVKNEPRNLDNYGKISKGTKIPLVCSYWRVKSLKDKWISLKRSSYRTREKADVKICFLRPVNN